MSFLKNKVLKNAASDFIKSALALVLFNGVIQIIIYPSFENSLGKEAYGNALFLISIISIMASTFGTAANYSRMVQSTKKHDVNSDYNIFLLITGLLCIPVCIALKLYMHLDILSTVLLIALMFFTILRFYGDCEYKLNINYTGYFFFYTAATVGYLIGLLLYRYLFDSWIIAILTGEVLSFIFVALRGKIYRPPVLKKSEHFKESMRSMWMLSGANIIPAIILNADRLLLHPMQGGDAVSVFYTASLVGKTISFITNPLNGVMIGYLSKYEGKFTKKMFMLFSAAILGVGLLATVACILGSYIFVSLLYPDYLSETKQYFITANAGQVFFFISATLMVVVLRFADEKYQTYINAIYAAVFAAVVPLATYFFGIHGFSISLLAVNTIKFAVVVAIGLATVERAQKKQEE